MSRALTRIAVVPTVARSVKAAGSSGSRLHPRLLPVERGGLVLPLIIARNGEAPIRVLRDHDGDLLAADLDREPEDELVGAAARH